MNKSDKVLKVLEVIGSGADLHDDTYRLQFLDALSSVINTKQDVDRYKLLQYINANQKTKPESRSFIASLMTIIIKEVPESTLEILESFDIPDPNDSQSLVNYLQFYRQVFINKNQLLPIMRILSQDNIFWDKFLFPVCIDQVQVSKYVTKEIQETLAEYVKFALTASEQNYSPKGCEIKVQLESNLKSFLQNRLESSFDLFDVYRIIIDRCNGDYDQEDFVLNILKENVNFDIVKKDSRYLTSKNMFYCFIKLMVKAKGGKSRDMEDYLTYILLSKDFDIHTKKSVISSLVKFSDCIFIQLIIKRIIDRFLDEDTSETSISLTQILLSSFLGDQEVFQKCYKTSPLSGHFLKVLTKFLHLYNTNSSWVSDKTLRTVTEFGKLFFKSFNPTESGQISEILLEISSQTMTVDDYIRNECLVLLRIVLENQKDVLPDTPKIIDKLCYITCDGRSLDNVRDSALECLSMITANINIKIDPADSDKILCLVKRILDRNERFLKHSAVLTFGHLLSRDHTNVQMTNILSLIYPPEDVNGLDFCDLYTDEERKAMVIVASNNWKYFEDASLQRLVVNFHLKTLEHDTFWEVKKMSVLFWNSIYEQTQNIQNERESIKYLEENQFFTGIILGLKDYEDVVKCEFYKLIQKLKSCGKLSFADLSESEDQKMEVNHPQRKKIDFDENSEIDEEEINDILDVNDKALIQMLSGRKDVESTTAVLPKQIRNISFHEFKQQICDIKDPDEDNQTDPETVLQSIIEDILQSSSEDCQLDLIDCY